MSIEECALCSEEMQKTDLDHPVLCETRCGYNFCMTCIQNFIASSKDDYMEASDGNKHVKVLLHCPNCRSDLSHTIRDTLLLRKVDTIRHADQNIKLTPSQLKLQDLLQQPEVRATVARARQIEAEYFGLYNVYELCSRNLERNSMQNLDAEYEEWGFEMDLDHGVHHSFRMPKPPTPRVMKEQPKIKIDFSLFHGLDAFLNEEERIFVTDLMTSGDIEQLLEAAQILRSVLKDTAIDPKERKPLSSRNNSNNLSKRNLFKQSSSFLELVKESQEVHHVHDIKVISKVLGKNVAPVSSPSLSRLMQFRAIERDKRKQAHFNKIFPIPVRMPKIVEINLRERFDMQVLDHAWDGTVMDAYSKISISFSGAVAQTRPNNPNVSTVLGGHWVSGDVQIELPGQPRIIVKDTGYDAGKQGAVNGDILTHVNGKVVSRTSEFIHLIDSAKRRGDFKITIALNADRSVSEALKRRASVIAELW